MWVGRTTSQLGDLEVRIQGEGADVSGSVKGTAIDTAYPFGRKGMRPEFALTIKVGAATGSGGSIKGSADGTGHVGGTMSGDIQYFDGLGNVTNCSSVVWSLEVVPNPLT
jgi:hypothetical protein